MKNKKRGRPNKLNAQTHVTLRLSKENIDTLKRMGNGSLTRGVREIIARYETLQNKKD